MYLFFPLYAGILIPSDEFQYWDDLSESAEKNSVRERATYFTEQFKHIKKVYMQTCMYQDWQHEQSKILCLLHLVFVCVQGGY